MARKWFNAALFSACALICASAAYAQATPQVVNPTSHGDKYQSGAFAFRMFGAVDLDSSFYRASRVAIADSPDEFGEGAEAERKDQVFGAQFDWQFGSSVDFVSTTVGLKFTSYSAESQDTRGNDVTIFDETVVNLGFDIFLNWFPSERVEADGRRRRDGIGFSTFFGPSINFMFGDLNDVRQLATISLDAGVVFDIPLSDTWQLMPTAWMEVNFHRNGAVDRAIFRGTDTNAVADPNNPLNDGFVVRSKTIIPPWQWIIGGELVYTPLFRGQDGRPINNWRFSLGGFYNNPFVFNGLQADKPSDPLQSSNGGGVNYFNIVLSAAYVWGGS